MLDALITSVTLLTVEPARPLIEDGATQSKFENQRFKARTGMTSTEVFDSVGLLNSGLLCGHCIWSREHFKRAEPSVAPLHAAIEMIYAACERETIAPDTFRARIDARIA